MSIELNSLLTTIASASASFVAILGGFIASKIITVNGERAAAQSSLKEIRFEKILHTEERDLLKKSLDEEDAICYVHNHMEFLANNVDLEQIYKEDELHVIDYPILLPYWQRAQYFKNLYDEYIQDPDCEFNIDTIPSELAEENTDDLFVYEFLKMYAGWCFSDYFENCEELYHRPWYEETRRNLLQENMKVAALEIQEHRYELDLKRSEAPKGIKGGLIICIIFSLFNIILPLSLSVFSFNANITLYIKICSIVFLSLGLITTFLYFGILIKQR